MNQLNWHKIAKKQGYSDPVQLVSDLYYVQGYSMQEVADRIIVSMTALHYFMDAHSLPKRERGGSDRRLKRGPLCPHCYHDRSRVCWGEENGDGIYLRKRKCHKCGEYFTTEEKAR